MIIISEHGRLGNQLFQYVSLRNLFPDQRLVLFGFDDLVGVATSLDATVVGRNKLPPWLRPSLLRRILHVLTVLRLLGRIREVRSGSLYELKKWKGFFQTTYAVEVSFFQHHSVTDRLETDFSIRPALLKRAGDWLLGQIDTPRRDNLVFVHVRRGDYLLWPNRENPAVIDLDWYERAMNHARQQIHNPLFLVVTDDLYYAQDVFRGQEDVRISTNDSDVDFALMSLCAHGILSASTFAWWGAYFSRQKNQAPGLYFAPKYWAGHRAARWYPQGFESDWISYSE
jgi:hypothetical protein